MKFSFLSFFVLVILALFILISSPFVTSLHVYPIIRISLFTIITFFFTYIILLNKKFLSVYLPFLMFFLLQSIYWLYKGSSIPGIVYFIFYTCFGIVLMLGSEKLIGLKSLIIRLYFVLIISFSILSILSFLMFNFSILPYDLTQLETKEAGILYTYYHNFIFGYINLKMFDFGFVGRVCGYMFEPSYLGWFLTTNFFMIPKLVKKKTMQLIWQAIVFLGAMATFSTMSWLVFFIIFLVAILYTLFSFLKFSKKNTNISILVIFILAIIAISSNFSKNKFIDILGNSSAEDRDNRISISYLYLVSASASELILGRSPSFIEKNSDKGESNEILKALVQLGIITTICLLAFIISSTYRNKYYMLSSILYLNSVVALFTPLFIVNILVCKWTMEKKDSDTST